MQRGKKRQPASDGINGKRPVPVLRLIDIAMGTGQIAFGQDVEKKI